MHITVVETISMGHRLPSYPGICNSMHGHNVVVEATIDTMGTFIDFKDVSRHLRTIIQPMDHAMVLYEKDPMAMALRIALPTQRLVLLSVEPTTENIAAYVFRKLHDVFHVTEVTVHETAKYTATCTKLDDRVTAVEP